MADQGSEGLLSPWLRKQRINAALPYLKGKVLDLGCGSGAMAKHINSANYVGVEIDDYSLSEARRLYPDHKFVAGTQETGEEEFNTVISLAVIEHVSAPDQFLAELASKLVADDASRIVITTPHPAVDWVHDLGASVGLFSKHANEEHEELLDHDLLESVGNKAGLVLEEYRRFLFGGNQIAVYKKP